MVISFSKQCKNNEIQEARTLFSIKYIDKFNSKYKCILNIDEWSICISCKIQ